jgi:signal transduction histidine kinase
VYQSCVFQRRLRKRREIVQPVDSSSLDTLMQKVQEGPQKVESVWRVGKEGQKLLPLCLSLSPVREGDFEGVCVIATNLTEQRHREQELAQTNAALINEVAKRMRVEDDLRRDEESLRQLSGRLLQLQDEERRRIARDLHDSTGQKLVALTLDLTVLGAVATKLPPKASAAVNECLVLAEQISSEIRTLSYLLHPPLLDELGLEHALQLYLDGFSLRAGIQATLNYDSRLGRLPPDWELALYRIVQEGLSNIHRHSGSSTLQLRVRRRGDVLALQLTDQGGTQKRRKGKSRRTTFVPGMGIAGMRERAQALGGDLRIESKPRGTVMVVRIPLPKIAR